MNHLMCVCGHKKSEHIYEEGACRPGTICASNCDAYVRFKISNQRTPREIATNIQALREHGVIQGDDLARAIERAIAAEREEITKWKDEYDNLCKFTTDFEQQRDRLREENERIRAVVEWARVNIPEMECRADEDCDHCLGLQFLTDLNQLQKESDGK